MGRYTTIFDSFNNNSLYSLFSSSNWNNLSNEKKLAACQEIENRLAAGRGTEPREIQLEDMNNGCYGYQYKDTIVLNSNLVNDGVFRTTVTDLNGNTQTRFVNVEAAGWEIFDTIHHEDMHGYWEDMGIMPDTYIQSDTAYSLYRIQACEKAAFESGENKTVSVIKELEEKFNMNDPEAAVYLNSHSVDSYQKELDFARTLYNDNDIENTLNTFIKNNDLGIAPPDMSSSYEAIDNLYYQQCVDNFLAQNNTLNNESFNQVSTEFVNDGSELLNSCQSSDYSAEISDDGAFISEASTVSVGYDGADISSSNESSGISSSSVSYDSEIM